ncbi:hypothetical protein SNOG_11534 [Parastagonospora nodorum SN15]|uniref:Uncharacterized protein n=1 Tax=Phaeosphaeria nodorum (strain SN15 / ATCC MYA-4574 / FGSC 10173) TaxID=321614 RepID=Q0U9N0_PHANO|nr:hypothetical protein SNOG_11534 [Parastagonospora nodorum SN15]EAT81242.1 hypothetical protein SNOG_11534 [Parastagonospora nodorum SN15]
MEDSLNCAAFYAQATFHDELLQTRKFPRVQWRINRHPSNNKFKFSQRCIAGHEISSLTIFDNPSPLMNPSYCHRITVCLSSLKENKTVVERFGGQQAVHLLLGI